MSEHEHVEDVEQAGSGEAIDDATGVVTAPGEPLPEVKQDSGDELPGHEVEMVGNSRGLRHGDRVTVDLATAARLVRDGHAVEVAEGDE